MMKKRILPVLTVAISLGFSVVAFADTVVLKSGKTIEGKLIEKADKYIKIDLDGVRLTYFIDEIASINGEALAAQAQGVSVIANNDADPIKILAKVKDAYGALATYKTGGTITADIEVNGIKTTTYTEYSMALKKPHFYLISWTQTNMLTPGVVQLGAVWNDGTGPYLYIRTRATNAYSKMPDDKTALISATGLSGGAAFNIPSIFFSLFNEQESLLDRLKNVKLEKTEQVGDEDCYVISGTSKNSKHEQIWIVKSNYLIRKYFLSFEPPEGGRVMPEFTDAQLEQAIKVAGLEFTPENKVKMRQMLKESLSSLKTTGMGGSSVEIYLGVSAPDMSNSDFKFTLPQGAVYKDSLMGGVVMGSNEKKDIR